MQNFGVTNKEYYGMVFSVVFNFSTEAQSVI